MFKLNNKEEEFVEVLDAAFNLLPKDLQDFIDSDQFPQLVEKIIEKYSLSKGESVNIQLLILMGIHNIFPLSKIHEDMIMALRERSDAEIEQIIRDIDEKILFRVKKINHQNALAKLQAEVQGNDGNNS